MDKNTMRGVEGEFYKEMAIEVCHIHKNYVAYMLMFLASGLLGAYLAFKYMKMREDEMLEEEAQFEEKDRVKEFYDKRDAYYAEKESK